MESSTYAISIPAHVTVVTKLCKHAFSKQYRSLKKREFFSIIRNPFLAKYGALVLAQFAGSAQQLRQQPLPPAITRPTNYTC